MPIDASIALQGRAPQFQNPLEMYAQMQQIQSGRNQNRLAELTFADAQRKALKKREFDAELASLTPEQQKDRNVQMGLYQKYFPQEAMQARAKSAFEQEDYQAAIKASREGLPGLAAQPPVNPAVQPFQAAPGSDPNKILAEAQRIPDPAERAQVMQSLGQPPAVAPTVSPDRERMIAENMIASGNPKAMQMGKFKLDEINRKEAAAATRQQQKDMLDYANRLKPDPKDEIISTSTGVFSRSRDGKMTRLVDPDTGQPLRPGNFSPNAERQFSKDFESHASVKEYTSLKPDVEVVNNYMKARPSVSEAQRSVYDKNLVNTFMRMTHPKGDQISNFERKDLGALPALAPRILKSIEGFFEGSYVPDDVAAEMAKVINDKFDAKEKIVSDIEAKMVDDVTRQGGNAATIRKVTRGKVPTQTPPPPPGFTVDK